jgi:hypothetical protein
MIVHCEVPFPATVSVRVWPVFFLTVASKRIRKR